LNVISSSANKFVIEKIGKVQIGQQRKFDNESNLSTWMQLDSNIL
jgi:hypothetical protein